MVRRDRSAATRKHSAPSIVPRFAQSRLSRVPVSGITYAPIADAPKKIEPSMFSHVPCHVRASVSQSSPRRAVAANASALATRNAIEPQASGFHPAPTYVGSRIAAMRAAVVLMLNRIVPANWTAAAHQSQTSARFVPRRGRCRPLRLSWMNAASVKKTDPTTNVVLTPTGPSHLA